MLVSAWLSAELPDEHCSALAQLIELGLEAAEETAGGAVGSELVVLQAAQVELELGGGAINPEICG